jgi:hypothetical protein
MTGRTNPLAARRSEPGLPVRQSDEQLGFYIERLNQTELDHNTGNRWFLVGDTPGQRRAQCRYPDGTFNDK